MAPPNTNGVLDIKLSASPGPSAAQKTVSSGTITAQKTASMPNSPISRQASIKLMVGQLYRPEDHIGKWLIGERAMDVHHSVASAFSTSTVTNMAPSAMLYNFGDASQSISSLNNFLIDRRAGTCIEKTQYACELHPRHRLSAFPFSSNSKSALSFRLTQVNAAPQQWMQSQKRLSSGEDIP